MNNSSSKLQHFSTKSHLSGAYIAHSIPEELGTDTSAWCCSTTTQVNTSISQCQCSCRSSHPHDKKFERQVRMQGRTLLQKSHLSGAYIAHWTSWSRDWTGLGTLVSLFLVFFLLHFCSFRELKLSLLPDGFSLHVKYTVS